MKIYRKAVSQWQPDGSLKFLPEESDSFEYEGPVLEAMEAPSPPPAPDYKVAAREQGAANVETARAQARLGNPNIISPYGTQTVTWGQQGQPVFDPTGYQKAYQDWSQTGTWQEQRNEDTGRLKMQWVPPTGTAPDASQFMTTGQGGDQPTITQTLDPTSQQIFGAQQQARLGLGNLAQQGIRTAQDVLGRQFQYSGPEAPVNAGTTAQEAIMSRLSPQIERERASLDTQLRNQGLVPGGEAYNREMTLQSQRENDLLIQAGAQGIGLDTQARQQAMQEQLYQRNLPLNEIIGLMSGSQIQNPQFQGYQAPGITPPPLYNAAMQQSGYNQGLYNLGVGQSNAFNTGLFNLGGALGSAWLRSDRRLKSNVIRTGTHPLGIGIYEYDIFGEREIGVMADEVLTVMPEAVALHPSGYLMVDYGRL